MTPNFDALYEDRFWNVLSPAPLLVTMIEPPFPAASIGGTVTASVLNTPVRLTPMNVVPLLRRQLPQWGTGRRDARVR